MHFTETERDYDVQVQNGISLIGKKRKITATRNLEKIIVFTKSDGTTQCYFPCFLSNLYHFEVVLNSRAQFPSNGLDNIRFLSIY